MATRNDRLSSLASAAKDYIKKEQERIDNEVSYLQAALDGRTGGASLQKSGVAVVEAVAKTSLSAYLKEA